jgi:hypothetical protein
MIKQYTTKPVFEHDADYPWYRPGYLPANTCDYPYHFPYFNSYPTYTVTTDFDEAKCNLCLELKKYNLLKKGDHKKHHKKHHKLHGESRLIHNILVVFTILIFVYLLANLTF